MPQMPYDASQIAMAKHVLLVSLLATLGQKNLLSVTDAQETVEQARLETYQHRAAQEAPLGEHAFQGARALLEQMRAALTH